MNKVYYSFTAEPFRLTPDHRMRFRHPSYQKVKTYIEYTVHSRDGFIMITGESGTGKTTLINDLLDNLPTKNLVTARLDSIHLESEELLRMVAFSFGLDSEAVGKTTLFRNITQFLTEQSNRGKKGLLIIDEGQALSFSALEELRLLSNIQDSDGPLLQVILVGQEKLLDIMRSPSMAQLHQRMIAACHLDPLASDQIEAYIKYRLRKVGWAGDPELREDMFPLIYEFSHGIPRRINLICKRLLLNGYIQEKHSLSIEHVQNSIKDLREEKLVPPDHDPATKPVRLPNDDEPVRLVADDEQVAEPVRSPTDEEPVAEPVKLPADHEQVAKPDKLPTEDEQAAEPAKLNDPMESSEVTQLRRHIYLKARDIKSSKSNRPEALGKQTNVTQKEGKRRVAAFLSLSVAAALTLILALYVGFRGTVKNTFVSLNEGTQNEQMVASKEAGEIKNQSLEEPTVSESKGDKGIQITRQAYKVEHPGIDEEQISSDPEPIQQDQIIQAGDQSVDQDENAASEIAFQQQPEEISDDHKRSVHIEQSDVSKLKKDQEVANFLALAKRQRQSFKLTIPAGDNACETYKKVLELDPDNQEAKVGLNDLVEFYRRRAISYRKKGSYDLSSEFIHRGLKIKPKNTELLALQEQIEKSLNSQSKRK